ncbi:hypothetical protein [Bradyrhizobium sp. WSM2254]|uniref:hypothetical protein n=1 Tax=Bradyrhizobium sp. WSM2254 TaxID=1188263 RepID=UPI0012EB1C38|nr:hypothetical protein [Bradyrhizobium sp. WSM2254]
MSGIGGSSEGGALRASCGRALQIFPEAMTDNILVIDQRKRLRVSSPGFARHFVVLVLVSAVGAAFDMHL